MAFFLTPRFAPAYQQHCGPFGCGPTRPSYRVSRPARPSFPSFVPFLGQLDELFGEIDREARRAAQEEQQQRKRVFRAHFDVTENKEGYEVDGEVPGFEQENISIEVTDEHTLKVAGNTEQKAEQLQAPVSESVTTTDPEATENDNDNMDGVTLNQAEVDHTGSDTDSNKSYQATVEDDFEDLGAETSSIVSTSSTTTAAAEEPKEPKGKEKAVEESTANAVAEQTHAEEPERREWLSERAHGSFERTFQFPERIDAANVRASLKNGVLSIHVPKAPAPTVKQITIQ